MKISNKIAASLGSMFVGGVLILIGISASASSYSPEIEGQSINAQKLGMHVISGDQEDIISITNRGSLYVMQIKK